MTEGILIALITGGLALLGNAFISASANSKTIYRIDLLEKKVEKHNNIVERTAINEREIKTVFKCVDELNDEIKELEHNR